jgi:hypothetical protein
MPAAGDGGGARERARVLARLGHSIRAAIRERRDLHPEDRRTDKELAVDYMNFLVEVGQARREGDHYVVREAAPSPDRRDEADTTKKF